MLSSTYEMSQKKLNILLIYTHYGAIAATVYDHVHAFKQYAQHNVVLFPLTYDKEIAIDMAVFDVVVIHYSVKIFYHPRFSDRMMEQVRSFSGVKALFLQDEYSHTNKVIERIKYMGISHLFTCVHESEMEKVYPEKLLPGLIKIQTLTGFVPEALLKVKTLPFKERTKDVVYRARRISAWYGRLGQEKWQIADKFQHYSQRYKLTTDIAFREDDRIYGSAWIDFIQSSKATLGVESGASVFDFTGTIEKQVMSHETLYPETSFEELEKLYFPELDGKIYMNQISPRAFESAALKTMMILYEGRYSDILVPWRHYVPLMKDFSNLPDVIEAIRDESTWNEITKNAYQEIALNPKYSYQNFITNFERVMVQAVADSSHVPAVYNETTVKIVVKRQHDKIEDDLKKIKIREQILKVVKFFVSPVYRFLLKKLSKETQFRFRAKAASWADNWKYNKKSARIKN